MPRSYVTLQGNRIVSITFEYNLTKHSISVLQPFSPTCKFKILILFTYHTFLKVTFDENITIHYWYLYFPDIMPKFPNFTGQGKNNIL